MFAVFLHGQRVGSITRSDQTGVLAFVLEEDYFAAPERDVLGQQFEDRRQHRVFRQAAHPGDLPAFFSNLLPEGALKSIVEAQMGSDDEARTLAFLGEDLPGAITVSPDDDVAAELQAPTFDEPDRPVLSPAEDELRFSLAGVQLKFSAVREPDDRFTLPFRGRGGRWILKFGSREYAQLVENELWTMQWAARAGLVVPSVGSVPVKSISGLDPRFQDLGPDAFVIERYDRLPDGTRVHQEDFAQVLGVPPARKYEEASYEKIARLVGDLCGTEDLVELWRRVVFCLLAGNTDAHLKNWSLVYPDRRRARLAPAYDLVFVRQYLAKDTLALPLAKERVIAKIGWDHVARVQRFLRDRGHDIDLEAITRDFVTRAMDAWQTHRGAVGAGYRAKLEQHHASMPLLRG